MSAKGSPASAGVDSMIAVAARAARTAGSIVLDAGRDLRRLPAFSKEHAQVVSAAEMEAEDAIVAAIRGAFPEHAILGKESAHIEGAREGGGYRWLVDPIDGAANFVHGYPGYAVSIALVHGAEITHAVVMDPVRDELFQAAKAAGATCNAATLHVSACPRIGDALVGTVPPARDDPRLRAYAPSLATLMSTCAGVRIAGSSALALAHVAAGRLDAFWMASLRPWDIAAGALLVKEAGGRIGDLAGGMQYLRTSEVIAASPGVFNAVRETVAAGRAG
jgi:myo-inositol-1(or 4)-monophosphatase